LKILITGVTGFAGKHLLEFLVKNHLKSGSCSNPCNKQSESLEILGVDINTECFDPEEFRRNLKAALPEGNSPKISMEKIDLREREKTEKMIKFFQPDRIYHLAAQSSVKYSWDNPVETFEVNVFASINILKSVKLYCPECRVLLACTAEEYATNRGQTADGPSGTISEKCSIFPENPYAISKSAIDFFALSYQKINNLFICVSRSFNHMGPGQSEKFVVSDFAKQLALIEKGLEEPVIFVGNLNVFRDFLDVRDVVRAYASIMDMGKAGEAYNVCSGSPVKISELMELLISMSNCSKEITVVVDKNKLRPIDSVSIIGNNSKIRQCTGWKPEYNLKKSLLDTLNWWRERS